ncbi:hypothetical protein MADA3029_300043 [Vibrio nigripulchritudo MADA3029]|nr:hypothetical protein MADA3029_300043 [Vibrio nigripulchritudo MADA3029]
MEKTSNFMSKFRFHIKLGASYAKND